MIKGKTKIELTNVHTGEVEVIEEENMALRYGLITSITFALGSTSRVAGIVGHARHTHVNIGFPKISIL